MNKCYQHVPEDHGDTEHQQQQRPVVLVRRGRGVEAVIISITQQGYVHVLGSQRRIVSKVSVGFSNVHFHDISEKIRRLVMTAKRPLAKL